MSYTEKEFEEMKSRVAAKKQGMLNPRNRATAQAPITIPKLKKKRNTPEADMQVALFDIIRLNETKWPLLQRVIHIPNGELRDKATAGKLKALGVRPGVWDISVEVPKWEDFSSETYNSSYPGLKIELKAPGKKLTPAQIDWGAYYKSRGFDTAVCFSWPKAFNRIVTYLNYDELKVKD